MKKENEYIATAQERMKDFEFRLLAKNRDVEAWSCQKPGSSFYAFQIMIALRGIAVFGDIDGMLFKVGSNYGMEFLAGDDITYYIHSKLDPQSKKTVFDQAYFNEIIYKGLVRAVAAEYAGDETLPEWLHEIDTPMDKANEFHALVQARRTDADRQEFWGQFAYVSHQANDVSSNEEAHQFLSDHEGFLCESDTWDYDFRTPDPELIQRLYMLNHAARTILQMRPTLQEAESEDEVPVSAPGI